MKKVSDKDQESKNQYPNTSESSVTSAASPLHETEGISQGWPWIWI